MVALKCLFCYTAGLLVLVVIFVGHANTSEDETMVEITSPLDKVVTDGILVVKCQIGNAGTDYTVLIARSLDGNSEQISADKSILEPTMQSRAFLSTRSFSDGSMVYFLTMFDSTGADNGKYTCTVITILNGRITELGFDSLDIKVVSFPETQPMCTSNPRNLIFQDDGILELTCSSYKTFPLVQLRWRLLSTYELTPSSNSSDNDNLYSMLYIVTKSRHNGAIFRCEMTSPSFPDHIRSCEIGPISVQSSVSRADQDFKHVTITPSENTDFESIRPAGECQNSCSPSSSTIFYLTVSTVVTCLLTFVFLITTIIMCCRYSIISSQSRQRQMYNTTPPSLTSDPVYVSLQRRNTNERVYMTLQDPNNPDGKVLLPKEVFDEFYNRTLTLRKT